MKRLRQAGVLISVFGVIYGYPALAHGVDPTEARDTACAAGIQIDDLSPDLRHDGAVLHGPRNAKDDCKASQSDGGGGRHGVGILIDADNPRNAAPNPQSQFRHPFPAGPAFLGLLVALLFGVIPLVWAHCGVKR